MAEIFLYKITLFECDIFLLAQDGEGVALFEVERSLEILTARAQQALVCTGARRPWRENSERDLAVTDFKRGTAAGRAPLRFLLFRCLQIPRLKFKLRFKSFHRCFDQFRESTKKPHVKKRQKRARM